MFVTTPLSDIKPDLTTLSQIDRRLQVHFAHQLKVQPMLTRSLVSFQANKTRPVYRWYKYKESFSATLVDYFLDKYHLTAGATLLDPFAGSGTALFVASARGLKAVGVELLPIGQQIIATKQLLENEFTPDDFAVLERWATTPVWMHSSHKTTLPELRITRGAYPQATHEAIEHYLAACDQENSRVRAVLRFVLLCVLEAISFTRKDGQYLRWDYRSGRKQGKKVFNKGDILCFEQAIAEKIREMMADLAPTPQVGLFQQTLHQGQVVLHSGSSLDVLPNLPAELVDVIVTSPPYCNRYDYTRTYALELALLDTNEKQIAKLRQAMLSCTVENRPKDLLALNPNWGPALAAADNQELLQAILRYLNEAKALGNLNNNGIPRMVRGYFYEMACIIAESARLLRPNAPLIMVNDNVRYAGASISVDLILSRLAEQLGFVVENILVLPNGKGNSSQQMGEHGREALRKCVYVWRKQ